MIVITDIFIFLVLLFQCLLSYVLKKEPVTRAKSIFFSTKKRKFAINNCLVNDIYPYLTKRSCTSSFKVELSHKNTIHQVCFLISVTKPKITLFMSLTVAEKINKKLSIFLVGSSYRHISRVYKSVSLSFSFL